MQVPVTTALDQALPVCTADQFVINGDTVSGPACINHPFSGANHVAPSRITARGKSNMSAHNQPDTAICMGPSRPLASVGAATALVAVRMSERKKSDPAQGWRPRHSVHLRMTPQVEDNLKEAKRRFKVGSRAALSALWLGARTG